MGWPYLSVKVALFLRNTVGVLSYIAIIGTVEVVDITAMPMITDASLAAQKSMKTKIDEYVCLVKRKRLLTPSMMSHRK